jgi:predicted ATPase
MRARVVGRELDLAAVDDFLSDVGGPRALVVTGEPGIGKTMLWEEGVSAARGRGFRVLEARANELEVQLSFVALTDLLRDVDVAAIGGVPRPQLRALEIALLRADPDEQPLDPFAVSTGFTTALALLADVQPLVIAVDDVPWLDRNSADALTFAARRLTRDVRFSSLVGRGRCPHSSRRYGLSGSDVSNWDP